ncbi:MAG TPA: porin, partial [Sutterella sp.]|nr:porin [Sutterella sp.]
MKKQLTIIAAVCAGLVSQAVFAANVQMYGRVDNGLYFTNTKVNGKTENSFTME